MFSKWLSRENAITIIVKAPALAERMAEKLECVSTLIQLNWNVKHPKEALLGFKKASTCVHTQLQWHSAVLSITSASINESVQKRLLNIPSIIWSVKWSPRPNEHLLSLLWRQYIESIY